ncbi:adenylate/guanylate cyclase domain-containing protein [Maribacter algarum]|uniref:Adenylate/guanylate cyclase domain-containing protein n=1 Tax=Maribacter algarum (ex Zhang et al. 2020) TaxID=2578118 RepID=A0A5S3QH33_9FLAO|nr:adenylate/guanylate cyclase domain-containing protein [Maribacter algarum]TMM56845.1 adenylate/guanylate cyclase domain-containing protein [Maribacter algarum]
MKLLYLGYMVHPKNIRRVKQILPFVAFWLIFSLVYSLIEYGIIGDLGHYPSTGNLYNFKGNLLFGVSVCLIVGLLQGCIEVLWLRKRFIHQPLWVKVVLKTIFYLLFISFFLILFSTLNSLINFTEGDINFAFEELEKFAGSFAFWSIVIYISVAIGMAILFSEMSQHLGDGVLYNFLFGKYHRPIHETRIFMFLDMKGSTSIAENIGHKRYFNLLKEYYADMTNAILETSGDIYQYVGDEIVVSWTKRDGLYKNNCIRCFEKIHYAIQQKKEIYGNHFGTVPEFKAGYHIGEVTTGEIGIIKKDIIYTGDILNTAARIQSQCNSYNAQALISENLLDELQKKEPIDCKQIGSLTLRGKKESIQLFSVVFKN